MRLKLLMAILSSLFTIMTTYGQGWDKKYYDIDPDTVPINARSLTLTTDGGFLIASSDDELSPWANASLSGFLIKTNVNGDTLWTKKYPFLSGLSAAKQTTDGGYILTGSIPIVMSGSSAIFLAKTDANGDTLWTKTFAGGGSYEFAKDVQQTADGGYIIVGSSNSFSSGPTDIYLIKTDASGNTLWTKTFGGSGTDRAYSVQQTTDGGYILVGYNASFGPGPNVYLIKTDANGNTLWVKLFGGIGIHIGHSVQQTTDGGYIIVGSSNNFSSTQMYLIKTDASGNLLWDLKVNDAVGNSVVELSSGGYFVVGTEYTTFSSNSIKIWKVNTSGVVDWTRSFNHSIDLTGVQGLEVGNGYAVLGHSEDVGQSNGNYLSLLRLDSLGHVYSNYIKGNIFNDVNYNCQKDSGEMDFSGIIVNAQGATGNWYSTTDNAGNYCINVDVGTYTVSVINPPLYWQPCANNISTSFSSPNTTNTIDFPLQAQINCPAMYVDISAPFIRRVGVGSNYTVFYENQGTVDATNVSIEVNVDADLDILGTSIPIASQVGNVLTFSIGTVPYLSSGSFTIHVRANQQSVLGQTHCTEAHIYPDTLCLPSWNGAILDATARCLADSVKFKVRNIGGGLYTSDTYFVFEDHVIMSMGPTGNIAVGDSIIVTVPADTGKSYSISVAQDPAYPPLLGDLIERASVEGCVPYPNGTFNTGVITQLTTTNSSPFIEVDCQQNRGSYDPNDKTAQPAGYDSIHHYIYDDTNLDYKIRFQNTGTDTAFLVVIRDTISPYLDLSTLTMGASSHPYTWQIYGGGILEITFQNIMLPDSNVNEPASNGFVNYSIEQQANNPIGTVIYNSAAIYFDFNAPIITNETWHTIDSNFIPMVLFTNQILDRNIAVQVYPNPFTQQTTIEVGTTAYENLELSIFDLTGKMVKHLEKSNSNQIQLSREGLHQGMYLYQLRGDGKTISAGKIRVL